MFKYITSQTVVETLTFMNSLLQEVLPTNLRKNLAAKLASLSLLYQFRFK